MRFEKILLLNPPYKGSKHSRGGALPVGLGYIAEMLEGENIEYDVLDMSLGYGLKNLVKKIIDFSPDLICVGMMTYLYKQTYNLISEIKKRFPLIKVAVGGQHASNFRDLVLRDCDKIDYLIILDGEQTIVDLCKGKSFNKIAGLMYKQDNKIVYHGDRPFVKDLDKISFPKYKKFEISKYAKTINILSTRGCPYLCTFCPVQCVMGRNYRVRSAENVIEEIKYWYDKGIRAFGFVDDNFTLIKERVHELCDLIEKNKFDGTRFECANGIRADAVDYNLLKRMREVNFIDLAYGVESADPQVLLNIKKGETIETIEQAVKWSIELGYNVVLYFIIGNPGETMKTIKESFRFALKYPVKDVYFYNVMPFPRTELYEWIKKNGRVIMGYEEYFNKKQEHWSNMPVFDTPEFSVRERKKAFRMAQRITKNVRKRDHLKNVRGIKKSYIQFLYLGFIYKLRNNQILLNNSYTIYKKLPQSFKGRIKRLYHSINVS